MTGASSRTGVMRACYKRPIPVKRIEELIDEIETEIFNKEEREVPSTVIGEIVMEKLKGPGRCGLCKICLGLPGNLRTSIPLWMN